MTADPATPGLTASAEDYLKAIYHIERGGGAATTADIAQRLGVAAPSVSGMVRRLADQGLLAHEPYRGVTLTEAGRRAALRTIRRHRLIETYLTQALGYSWDRVHDEAERLEHAISPELSELIAHKLGNPTHDPHGDPIPSLEGQMDDAPSRSLAELQPGERGAFARVSDSNPEMLRYLSERGIERGAEVRVVGREPFGGPIVVRSGGRDHALGPALAQAMRVVPVAG